MAETLFGHNAVLRLAILALQSKDFASPAVAMDAMSCTSAPENVLELVSALFLKVPLLYRTASPSFTERAMVLEVDCPSALVSTGFQ
jgi:hypothetical protein